MRGTVATVLVLSMCPTCHMSGVMFYVSHVTSQVSHVTSNFFLFLFFYKVLELVVGGSVINGAYPN